MMEEKIIKNKPIFSIIFVPTIILLIGAIISAVILQISYSTWTGFSRHKEHDENCVMKDDPELDYVPVFSMEEYEKNPNGFSSFSDYIEAEYSKLTYEERVNIGINEILTCNIIRYGGVKKAFNVEIFGDPFNFIVHTSGIIAGIIFSIISFVIIKKGFYQITITESTIYGKKGGKKFDISFNDIINVKQKGKCITIETENKKLKLSPLKNCEEIYNHMKSFVVEEPVVNNVDSIKNILD